MSRQYITMHAVRDDITADKPWILPLTGDLARTSQRGTVVTVMGPKQADSRLTSQQRTGKSMCQSSGLYTPAVAGFATEAELMHYFNHMVSVFQEIEREGFCVVKGNGWKVHIKVVVVADLSVLHKYVQRGGGSHSAICFCMLCGAFRDFRHEGYCGGCRKCRRAGTVYGPDGLQQCLVSRVPFFLRDSCCETAQKLYHFHSCVIGGMMSHALDVPFMKCRAGVKGVVHGVDGNTYFSADNNSCTCRPRRISRCCIFKKTTQAITITFIRLQVFVSFD